MASPAALTELARDTARQSLIAISQSVPEIGSSLSPNVELPSTPVANGCHDDATEKYYRSKLISISYQMSPDALPKPCPPKNVAA